MDLLHSLPTLGAILGTFLLAGLVKGVIGLGLPTIAMGLLGTLMPPAEAAALLVLPSLVTNFWQFMGGPALPPLLRRLGPMLAAVALGTLAGVWAGLLPG
ncbi:sulfite exporter TauE/SafE family protein, partial [Pseudoroseomonas wenyumeiae]